MQMYFLDHCMYVSPHLPLRPLQSLILGCPAGLPLMKIIMAMAAIFQVLFTDFYIKAYRKKATQVRDYSFFVAMFGILIVLQNNGRPVVRAMSL